MRNMTNCRARILGKKDLKAVFKTLRIKDGIDDLASLADCGAAAPHPCKSLNGFDGSDEIKPDEFSYWYNKNRDGTIGNYIIYEVIDSEPSHRADDKVFGREFYAQIDVFSIRSFESKELSDFLVRLEEKLTEYLFEVEMQGEEYEQDTRLYRQTLFVSKIYF